MNAYLESSPEAARFREMDAQFKTSHEQHQVTFAMVFVLQVVLIAVFLVVGLKELKRKREKEDAERAEEKATAGRRREPVAAEDADDAIIASAAAPHHQERRHSMAVAPFAAMPGMAGQPNAAAGEIVHSPRAEAEVPTTEHRSAEGQPPASGAVAQPQPQPDPLGGAVDDLDDALVSAVQRSESL